MQYYNIVLGDDKDNFIYMYIIMLFVKIIFYRVFFEIEVYCKCKIRIILVEVIKKFEIIKVRDKK